MWIRQLFGKTDEAFKHFCKHDPLYNYAAEIKHEIKDLIK